MSRTFKTVDYEAALDLTVRLGDCLPPDHLARFVVDSVALLDLSALYAHYGSRGGEPYAPEGLLALLLYGYATGVLSSRKIERATYESVPFRYIAGNRHPDHDTIATFRATFLPDLKGLFVQVLLLAQEVGVLTLGTISLDGTKIHADASKSKAVRYKRLVELEAQLRAEVEELFALAERTDEREQPDGWSCATRSRGGRTGWLTWRRRRRCLRSGPVSGRPWSGPRMRTRWPSGRSRSRRRGTARVDARRLRPCRVPAPRISTTLRTPRRAS